VVTVVAGAAVVVAVVVGGGGAEVLGSGVVAVVVDVTSRPSPLQAATPRIAIEAAPLLTVVMNRRLESWDIARLLGSKR
jgi:hypothetical protein